MKDENQYLELLSKVLEQGELRPNRTGTDTIAIFGTQSIYDISVGFPLLTTKKVDFHAILVELLWFISGNTNIKFLLDHKVHIWDAWADDDGNLGPVYGAMWRRWPTKYGVIDQIKHLETQLKVEPHATTHILNSWNITELENMALPPCHILAQYCVSKDNILSCHLYQRSADLFLGVPFNIASYALLTIMFAHICGYKIGKLIHTIGDSHIYVNHLEQVRTQLQRLPIDNECQIYIKDTKETLDDFKYEDFVLEGYKHQARIPGVISV